jgi:DNA repair photolyase
MVMNVERNEIRLIHAGRILTPASGYLRGYTHTLNPYVGCGFGRAGGCGVYCYVAESPVGLFAGAPWGTWVRAKTNAADGLRRELARMPDISDVRVFMGSATDPYQPAESSLEITRGILEVFRERHIGTLVVQTRSPLVERDFDLLAAMPYAWLSMTVETNDEAVRRALTPTCPSIARRLGAMRLARERGIRVQAAVSPVLPHNRERFVDLLEQATDRVVVDTLFGDGADGKRSSRRPIADRYRELRWGDWRDTTAAAALFDALVERMGADRAGWAQEGFNVLAVKSGVEGGVNSNPGRRMMRRS